MTGVLIRRGSEEKDLEDRGGDGSKSASQGSQGPQAPPGSGTEAWSRVPLSPQKEPTRQHLDLGVLASRAMGECISVVHTAQRATIRCSNPEDKHRGHLGQEGGGRGSSAPWVPLSPLGSTGSRSKHV